MEMSKLASMSHSQARAYKVGKYRVSGVYQPPPQTQHMGYLTPQRSSSDQYKFVPAKMADDHS